MINLLEESVKAAVSDAMAEAKQQEATGAKSVILHVGTNNWQSSDEPAPGSGILHEALHDTLQSFDDVVVYSIWPSFKQKNADWTHDKEHILIYELDKNIPVVDTSPCSRRRLHEMTEEEVTKWRVDLEVLLYDYLIKIKQKEGQDVTYIVAHHTFMNPIVTANVNAKRLENDLDRIPVVSFNHGTALKMFQLEMDENRKDYPMTFFPMVSNRGFYNPKSDECLDLIYNNSEPMIKVLLQMFPTYPNDRMMISFPGYNALFKPIKDITLKEVLAEKLMKITNVPYPGSEAKETDIEDDFDEMVLFVGKFAEWKRIDCLLRAANIYEKAFDDRKVLTLLVGSGGDEDIKAMHELNQQLGNENVRFCGPKMHAKLTRLYNAASVGVFPSKDEPFGMVYIECMACGTPVIGANSGGPRSFVTKECGFLVDESDDKEVFSKGIANAVIDAIKNDWKATKSAAAIQAAAPYSIAPSTRKVLNETLKRLFSNK